MFLRLQLLLILSLQLSVVVSAQVRNSPIQGRFVLTEGLIGRQIDFDSNGKFRISNYECLGSTAVDSGTWKANADQSFSLRSTRFKNDFYLIKYDRYLFLISNAEKAMFTKEFCQLDADLKEGEFYGTAAYPLTKAGVIYNKLARKYYIRRL